MNKGYVIKYYDEETSIKLTKALENIVKSIGRNNGGWQDALREACKKNLNKMTVHAMECFAGNHAFDDYPQEFGISKNDGHLVREYFQNYGWQEGHVFINALYEKFPDFFEGEPKEWVQNRGPLSDKIPLF
ncbi:MAG: hypothetical protein KC516_01565 [Nanoarchaeota archaeon]|nr:hypothetical protein [Nanoarchaeota archaeon]